MSKLISIVGIVVVGLFVCAQVCAARDFGEIYTDCGIGSMFAPKNSAVAAVTNVTWDLGTTAISSNISCPDTCKGGQERVASFIYESYDSLEKDLAKGNGEYLDTLISLVENTTEKKDLMISKLRSGFRDIVSEKGYIAKTRYQKSECLYNLVYKHTSDVS